MTGRILGEVQRRKPMILDSGARRSFDSGAVRDISEGKGRCDLLPLKILSKHLNDKILESIDKYVREGDAEYLWFAIEQFSADNLAGFFNGILEVSKQYEEGAKKYSDRNWEKGMPVHCFIDSGVRHYLKFLRGDTDEPHDRAFIWNMLGAIWMHENHPKMIDLPFNISITHSEICKHEVGTSYDPKVYLHDDKYASADTAIPVNWKDGAID
jgi:hypothetical protein